jgi:dihydroorotate dehydrogenase
MKLTKSLFNLYKNIIFMLPAETAHSVSLASAEFLYKSWIKNMFITNRVNMSNKLMGLDFPNKLGLAAGFDKNGDYLNFDNNIGLGFIELGTVTPKAQYGNSKPRIFRSIKDTAIINHLGFNNKGVQHLKNNLQLIERSQPIGINIGKNSSTAIELAHEDYQYCMKEIFFLADYITLNISSPNTSRLRELHSDNYLDKFLSEIKKTHDELTKKYKKKVPLVLKISPDIEDNNLEVLCKQMLNYEIDGVIATNTTIDKNLLMDKSFLANKGGVSGKPLLEKSNNLVKNLKNLVKDNIIIIGAGGITSRESAVEKLNSGADLLQLYTGLVYFGLDLIKEITEETK